MLDLIDPVLNPSENPFLDRGFSKVPKIKNGYQRILYTRIEERIYKWELRGIMDSDGIIIVIETQVNDSLGRKVKTMDYAELHASDIDLLSMFINDSIHQITQFIEGNGHV